jgi:hypothetical protein
MSTLEPIFELIKVIVEGSFGEFDGIDYDVFAVEGHDIFTVMILC